MRPAAYIRPRRRRSAGRSRSAPLGLLPAVVARAAWFRRGRRPRSRRPAGQSAGLEPDGAGAEALLSMVAVVSKTPSSIQQRQTCVRTAFWGSLFSFASPPGHGRARGEHLDTATAVDRSGRPLAEEPGSHYRRPPDRGASPGDAGTVTRVCVDCTRGTSRRNRPVTIRCYTGRLPIRPAGGQRRRPRRLDERTVALDVDLATYFEQPPTTADQQQQPAPRVVVVLVGLEVLGEIEMRLVSSATWPPANRYRSRADRSCPGISLLLGGQRHADHPSVSVPRNEIRSWPPRTAAHADRL